ncbi:MAG: metallophosphoesterase [Ruminococcus sp.]|nr:metallophosphoesterase [Ruminococcus sp.]
MNILKRTAALTAAALLCIISSPRIPSAAAGSGYIITEPAAEKSGVLTLDDGQQWYRVNSFEDDGEYIITVKDGSGREVIFTASDSEASEYIWRYYRRIMVSSVTPRYTSLNTRSFSLCCHENELYTASSWWTEGDCMWEYVGGSLRYTENGSFSYLKYNEDSSEPFSCTENASEAAQVSLYSRGGQLGRCIKVQPHAESYVLEGSGYAAPRFTAELSPPDMTVDSIRWFADGEEQSCASLTFTADTLRDRPAGTHYVSCLIEGHDSSGIHYRERSEDALFVIAKGVIPDSVLTFSDLHEQYDLISTAIGDVMKQTGGYIPSLVICTGDMVHGPTMDKDSLLERYYPRIVSRLGGLDAVFVSGNHDSGAAASAMSAAAGLGAENNTDGGGTIFRGGSPAASANGRNSRYAKGLIVYGLNFEAAETERDGLTAYSYENALSGLEAFLKKTAADYKGELVIISTHSGLHVLGIQPESVSSYSGRLSSWIGENQYNVSRSCDMAQLINSYAEKYGMDIMYLFGHDHSRQEAEILMTEGDTLVSTADYYERSYSSQPLHFTYANSGYLSTSIGSADAHFSFIYRDGDKFGFDRFRAADGRIFHEDIPAKNLFTAEEAQPATTQTATAAKTAVTTASTKKTDSPLTGSTRIKLVPLVIAAAALLLSRKKKNK